jgi:hypothetical protein
MSGNKKRSGQRTYTLSDAALPSTGAPRSLEAIAAPLVAGPMQGGVLLE